MVELLLGLRVKDELVVFEGEVEVGAVTLEAFGEAERGPVGDFVVRALVDGGVVETPGEMGRKPCFFIALPANRPDSPHKGIGLRNGGWMHRYGR